MLLIHVDPGGAAVAAGGAFRCDGGGRDLEVGVVVVVYQRDGIAVVALAGDGPGGVDGDVSAPLVGYSDAHLGARDIRGRDVDAAGVLLIAADPDAVALS